MKTLVIGASENPERYSYKAITQLKAHGKSVIAFGLKDGEVAGVPFETVWSSNWQVDTVTLYIGPARQPEYQDAILALKPRRVIFNPGTENPAFYQELSKHGIAFEEACTLVLLSIGEY